MKVPARIRLVAAYFAFKISPAADRESPPLRELINAVLQKGKVARAMRFASQGKREPDGSYRLHIDGYDRDLLYPPELPLDDLYCSIELCFDFAHWHCYWIDDWRPAKGDWVVDCGVAEGLFSIDVARGGAKVVGFEPMAQFRSVHGENLKDLDGVEILAKAAGSERGEVMFAEMGAASSIAGEGIPTEVSTIDHEMREREGRLAMIKADVEGFEYDVLLGAQEMIRKHKPRLAITVYHHQNNVPQIEDLLKRLHANYRVKCRGIAPNGHPVMLHAWCDE